VIKLLEGVFELIFGIATLSIPILLISVIALVGGFIYKNNKNKNACLGQYCHLEEKLANLKQKLYYLPIWVVISSMFQST